jgi:hypothetical protein
MKSALVLLALLALAAGRARAQVTVDFTPQIGAFVPLRDLAVGTDANGATVSQKNETKFTIGGRIGVWFSSFLGFEGVVDYNKSGVMTFVAGAQQAPTLGSHLFATSGRAMIRLNPGGGRVALILSGGAGLVDRGGEYINGGNPPATKLAGRTDFAPAAGAAFVVRLTRDVAARIGADGYTYRVQYFNPTLGATGNRRQYDLLISFGLTGPFRNYGLPGGY